MSISFASNRSYAPIHPGIPSLPDNPKLNSNLTCLYSHCGQQLGLNGGGHLFVLNNAILQTSTSSIVNFVNSLFGSFGGLGFDANKQATLFDVKARDVRQCTVQTMNDAIEIMQGKGKDSAIGLLDMDPLIASVPKEIRNALEILYLNGVTPYTYEQITNLLKVDIAAFDLPLPLKNELLKLKEALSDFEWFKPIQEFHEVQLSPVDIETLMFWYTTLKTMDESLITLKCEFSGFNFDRLPPHDEAPSNPKMRSAELDTITEGLKKLGDELESEFGKTTNTESYPEINALLNLNIDELTDLSLSTKTALIDLKSKLPVRHSTKTYTEIIELEASTSIQYDREFRQFDRNGWLYMSKKVKTLAEGAFSSSLRTRYAHQLLAPWKEINKRIVNGFIDDESTRSFMDDPACRVVTKKQFAQKLANLFSMNGINMDKNFPELATCYAKLLNTDIS